MKKMSKILALALALIMMLSLAACGGEQGGSEAGTEAGTEAGGEQSGETVTLTMATSADFPPWEYYEGDKIVGIDPEIAQAIADKLGMELVIEDGDFTAALNAVASGKADIGMSGITVTEDRKETYDFTDVYGGGVQVVIVKKDGPITTLDQVLSGEYGVGVQLGTTGDTMITVWEGLEPERYTKGADAVYALTSGKIDCVVIDSEPAKAFVAENEGLKILETAYADEDYAIILKKGNTELFEKVNGALKELIADGTVQEILDKYIEN